MSGYYLDPRVAEAYDGEPWLPRDDVPFYVDLARQAAGAGGSVLELGCGTGRVTIPIAEAGIDVVGLDNAAPMLAVARRKSAGLAKVRWVEGDMRAFALDQRFGLVIIPYRSFLLLLTDADQQACLSCVRRHLPEGGLLALNVFNPDLRLIADWQKRRGELRPMVEPAPHDRVRWWGINLYDTERRRLRHTRVREEVGGDGAVISRLEANLRMRYVFRDEMEGLLAGAGFAVEALYGGFDRRPFESDSPEMVWVARRTQVADP